MHISLKFPEESLSNPAPYVVCFVDISFLLSLQKFGVLCSPYFHVEIFVVSFFSMSWFDGQLAVIGKSDDCGLHCTFDAVVESHDIEDNAQRHVVEGYARSIEIFHHLYGVVRCRVGKYGVDASPFPVVVISSVSPALQKVGGGDLHTRL